MVRTVRANQFWLHGLTTSDAREVTVDLDCPQGVAQVRLRIALLPSTDDEKALPSLLDLRGIADRDETLEELYSFLKELSTDHNF